MSLSILLFSHTFTAKIHILCMSTDRRTSISQRNASGGRRNNPKPWPPASTRNIPLGCDVNGRKFTASYQRWRREEPTGIVMNFATRRRTQRRREREGGEREPGALFLSSFLLRLPSFSLAFAPLPSLDRRHARPKPSLFHWQTFGPKKIYGPHR